MYAVVTAQPTHGTSGLLTPVCNNGAYTMLRNVVVSGYFNGIVCNEHTDGDGIVVAANVNGLSFSKVCCCQTLLPGAQELMQTTLALPPLDSTGAHPSNHRFCCCCARQLNVRPSHTSQAFHASRFGRVGAYRNTYQVDVTGAHGFAIQQLAIETAGPCVSTTPTHTPTDRLAHTRSHTNCRRWLCRGQTTPANAWQKTIADINDPKNLSFADISYWVVEGNVGPVATFTKVGGASIQARRIGAAPACPLKTDGSTVTDLF